MKKVGKRLLTGILAVMLTFTMTPFGSVTAEAKTATQVTSVKITKSTGKTIKLLEGKSYQLKVKVAPSNAANKKVTYQTSNKKVATVSASGKIKAVKKGTAKITVASQSDKKKKATVTVKVTVPVKKITITSPDTKNLVLKKGKTYKLKTSVLPSNAANKKLTYTTSKKKYVTVSSKGKITAKAKGSATITAKAKDGSGKKAAIKVTVGTPVTKVTLDRSSFSGEEGTTVTLKAATAPSNATIKKVAWTSSNKSVAAVNANGMVSLKKEGTAQPDLRHMCTTAMR